MVQAFANNAEGGSNGTVVTPANSGGASGDAFSVVSIAADGTLVFDTSQFAHGSMSYKFASATAVVTYARYTFASAISVISIRVYLRAVTPPSTSDFLAGFSGTTRRFSIRINNTRKLSVVNAAGTAVGLHTVAPTAGSWIRVEAELTISATTGTFTLRRYDSMDATTPSETSSGSSINFGGASIDNIRVGIITAGANIGPFNIDDLAFDDTGNPIGPVLIIRTDAGTAAISLTASGVSKPIRSAAGTASIALNASGVSTTQRSASRTAGMMLDTSGISHTIRTNQGSAVVTLGATSPSNTPIRIGVGNAPMALSTTGLSTTLRTLSLAAQQILLTASGISSKVTESEGSTNLISLSASGVSNTTRINGSVAVVYLTASGVSSSYTNRDVTIKVTALLGRDIEVTPVVGRDISVSLALDRWKVVFVDD